ncbi:unnamed protein product [Closterium sp. Naga37s-1]|nr:unnamed protein product [Closterium sp. Naga37s-1]
MAIGPHVLMTHADVAATSSNSSKAPSLVSPSLLRSRALDFVTSNILTKAPKESIPAVESLMRYLYMHAPERAEGRAAAVEAVVKVYETVGRKEREGFFLFVGKLARVDRAAARVMAVDLSAALVERMALMWGRGEGGGGSMGLGAMEEGGAGGSRDAEGGDPGIGRGSGEAAGGEGGNGAGGEGGDGEGDKGDEVSLSQGSASEGDAHSGRESGNGTGVGNDSRESGDSSGNGNVRDVLISRVGGCLELMFRRASDASPTVRARALVALTASLRILKGRPSLLDAVLAGHAHAHAPAHAHAHAQAEPGASVGGGSGLSGESEPGAALGAGSGGSVLSVEEVLGMVRRRLEDEKGLVRKAAVGALEEIVGLSKLPLREELVDAIGELCSDSLLSVRRVALTALSKLTMSNPGHVWLRSKWLKSALVLILDNEASVQDQALDLLSSLLLQPLALISASPRPSSASRMSLCKDRPLHVCVGRRGVPPAPVLCEGEGVCEVCGRAAGVEGAGAGGGNAAAGEARAPVVAEGSVRSAVAWLMAVGQGNSSVVPLLHRACAVLARRNALNARLVEGLQAVIEAAEGWQNAHQQQQQQQQQQQLNGKGSSVGKAAGVKGSSPCRVWRWVVRGAWLLLLEVTSFSPQGVRWEFLISRWRDGRKQQEAANRSQDEAARPEPVSPAHPEQERDAQVLDGQEREAQVLDGQEREAQVHVLKALCNVAARIPGEKAADVAAGLLHNLRSFQLSPEEELQRSPLPSVRNNLSVIPTDLCELQCSPLPSVRNNLIVILTELQRSPLPSVRNNLVIILTDLCVRYTALVDPHVPCISACLRDPCELVRRQTLVLLAGLLQRDYVKWRGALVLRVLLCLVDESQAIREVALYLFTHVVPRLLQRDYVKWRGALVLRVLLCIVDESQAIREVALYLFTHVVPRRVPLVPYNIFIEALFALNACPFAPSSTTTAPPLPSSGLRPSSSSPPNPASSKPGSTNPSSSKAGPCDPAQPNCPNLSSPVEGIHEGDGWPEKRGGRSGRGAGAGREGVDEELERFSLSGPSRHAARTTVYRTLLRLMAREHHLALSAKLCLQVLAPLLDGALPLLCPSVKAMVLAPLLDGALPLSCPSVQAVVGDALDVLSCKEMRPGSGKAAAGAEEDGEEEAGGSAGGVAGGGGGSGGGRAGGGAGGAGGGGGGGAGALANALKGRVVTQLMKKNLVENTIPVLIELKRLLEAQTSPLQGALMACLRCLFKEYKEEIEDLLAADPQLGKELVYDIQKHESARARAAAAARAAGSDSAAGGGGRVGAGGVGGGGGSGGEGKAAAAAAAAASTPAAVAAGATGAAEAPDAAGVRLTREGGEVGGRGCESEVERRMSEREEGESEEACMLGKGRGGRDGRGKKKGGVMKENDQCASLEKGRVGKGRKGEAAADGSLQGTEGGRKGGCETESAAREGREKGYRGMVHGEEGQVRRVQRSMGEDLPPRRATRQSARAKR